MVRYGRFSQKQQEGSPEVVELFEHLVDAVGVNEKVEIFKVTFESLGDYQGKFEVVKVEKRGRKKRAQKSVDSSTPKTKRKYTKKAKYWKK